jgi:DNA-binding NarL/FixJ family response regulator
MIRVAIADSDEGRRASIRALLEAASDVAAVNEAFDSNSTLALLQSTQLDVLTLGLLMPGLHGDELIREMKKLQPTLRIIVVSALGTKDDAVRAFKAGASGFVVRSNPADDDLLAAIRRVVSGGVYVNL